MISRLTRWIPLFLLVASTGATAQVDPRTDFDVKAYRLDVKVDPATQTLSGTGVVVAQVTARQVDSVVIDLMQGRTVSRVNWVGKPVTADSKLGGAELRFDRADNSVTVHLPKAVSKGGEARIAVTYTFTADASARRSGINFGKTPDGQPWISTSCQNLGAHSWWPCKAETIHPEDKHERIFINATVPKGLTAVANGRLWKRSQPEAGWETFHWSHDYPCEAYAVALNIAPYVELKSTMTLPGLADPLPVSYYVLPQDVEKAKLQFGDSQRMMEIYSEAFGPFPFPKSKFCLVQTNYWGMEHSTVVAYGNGFPKWLKQNNLPDTHGDFNRLFDYILIHEVAHEWWGNAVSAKDWGHFWIHEGFGTYTEGVYVEKIYGRDEADKYFKIMGGKIDPAVPIYRGKNPPASAAYHINLYYKGACVLNTLRHVVNNDDAWWKSIREFNMNYRYKNAVTEEFQAILEKNSSLSLGSFFQEWFYGKGAPALKGTVKVVDNKIVVNIQNPPQEGTEFHVPIDLEWQEGTQSKSRRILLNPGSNSTEIVCAVAPTGVKVLHLDRILGKHDVVVE